MSARAENLLARIQTAPVRRARKARRASAGRANVQLRAVPAPAEPETQPELVEIPGPEPLVEIPGLEPEVVVGPNTIEFDEAGLAEASIFGDCRAFEQLYSHYFPRVKGFCLRKLGDRELAEDVAQEAFARAFERISDFGGPKHFGGWVSTIAANLCTDHLRRRKNTPISLEIVEKGPSYDIDPIKNVAREHAGQIVRGALDRLEPRQREALLLHEVTGMSCAAVGDHLGISEVAAESLLARARRRLRKEIVAKAVPADLFGVGGVATLPAWLRAWRRVRESASRRLDSLQATAVRGWEGVSSSLIPAVDGGKALVVAMGAGLAIGVVSAAAPPVHRTTDLPQPAAAVTPAGSQAPSGGAKPGSKPPVNADVNPDKGAAGISGRANVPVPPAPGTQGRGSTDFKIEVDTGSGDLKSTSVGGHVTVRGDDGTVIVDSGEHHATLS